MTKAKGDKRREERLARALRENLKRRKAQNRARAAAPSPPDGEPAAKVRLSPQSGGEG